jgi:serine/threonine protein kinase
MTATPQQQQNGELKREIDEELRRNGITFLAIDPIGKGCFSTVNVAYSSQLKDKVAVKLIDMRVKSEYIERYLPREVALVPTLDHSNVVKVHQIFQTTNCTALIQEYCQNGDLLTLIRKKKRIDEVEARFLFRQLIEAMKYLSQKYIVHRDIKCENIFLDGYNNAKLGDFGFARFLYPEEDTDTHCGSKAYVAPELLQGLRYASNAGDIWSAGVVLFATLTGKMPYDDRKPVEMFAKQMRHSIPFPTNVISPDAQKLIRSMVHPDRRLRATIDEIISSDWLKDCRYFMRGKVDHDNDDDCSTASRSDASTTTSSDGSTDEFAVSKSRRNN